MSAHGPMPRSSWLYPVLAVLMFAAITASGYSFAPSPGGWLFALAHEPKLFVPLPGGGHDDLDGFGAMEIARRFIDGKG